MNTTPVTSLKRWKDQGCYDGLIGSRMCAFDSYQNQWPWMSLIGPNTLLCKKIVREPTVKIWTKKDPNCEWQNVGQWFYFCRNIRFMQIFAGLPYIPGVKWQWVSRNLRCSDLTLKPTLFGNMLSHVGCSMGPKCETLNACAQNATRGLFCWLWNHKRPRRPGCPL